jgi:outer membrane lipoprotein-sorting protein
VNRWTYPLLFGLIVTLMAGCSPSKKIVRDHPLGPEEIFALVNERNTRIRTLQGDGLITVESPEGSHNGSFDVRLKKPDSLRLEFHGPFGVQVGTLLLSRLQFLYYNKMDNTATIGRPDGKTLRSMFRLKMQFDEVLHAFTGEFPPAVQGDSLLISSERENEYVLHYRTADGEKEYTIDGDSFVVTGYRVVDGRGNEILTASASRIHTNDSIPVPRVVRVTFPQERRSVTIAYDDITLNQPTECSFQVPKQAEVINRE